MNLVNKQHIAFFQIRQNRRQIAAFFDRRRVNGFQIRAEFIGDNYRQTRFPESRRTEKQNSGRALRRAAVRLSKISSNY